MPDCNGCGLDFGSDYNRWGCDGYYLPLVYGIYYNEKKQVVDSTKPDPEPEPGNDNVRVEGDTLIIPAEFEVAYVDNDMVIIQNPGVTVDGMTLNFIN